MSSQAMQFVTENFLKQAIVQSAIQQNKLKDITMTTQNHLRCVGFVMAVTKNGTDTTSQFTNSRPF